MLLLFPGNFICSLIISDCQHYSVYYEFTLRTLSHLESLQSEIQETNGKCTIYSCDFEKMENIKNEMSKALDAHNIDLLVNNAGIKLTI